MTKRSAKYIQFNSQSSAITSLPQGGIDYDSMNLEEFLEAAFFNESYVTSIQLPSGTTVQRPDSPINGMIRYNSELNKLEGYENGAWINLTNSISSTDELTEGATNLYYTDARSRAAISLTTTGTSGAATYDSGTGILNIPSYTGFLVTNEADNRIITSSGAGTGNAEANLTFDGNFLGINTIPTSIIHLKGSLTFQLTGTVSVTFASTTVIGSSTSFVSQLAVGDSIKIGTEIFTVSEISDNNTLTLNSPYQGSTSSGMLAYTDPNLFQIDNGDGIKKVEINRNGNFKIGTVFRVNSVNKTIEFSPELGVNQDTYSLSVGKAFSGAGQINVYSDNLVGSGGIIKAYENGDTFYGVALRGRVTDVDIYSSESVGIRADVKGNWGFGIHSSITDEISSLAPAIQLSAFKSTNALLTLRPVLGIYNYTTKLAEVAANGNWNFRSNQLKNIADPTDIQDAATKAYVDTEISGIESFSVSNESNNRIITSLGAGLGGNAEENLRFNGTTMEIIGSSQFAKVLNLRSTYTPSAINDGELYIDFYHKNIAEEDVAFTRMFSQRGGVDGFGDPHGYFYIQTLKSGSFVNRIAFQFNNTIMYSNFVPNSTSYTLGSTLSKWGNAYLHQLNVDNLRLDLNTLSSTDENGNIELIAGVPSGTTGAISNDGYVRVNTSESAIKEFQVYSSDDSFTAIRGGKIRTGKTGSVAEIDGTQTESVSGIITGLYLEGRPSSSSRSSIALNGDVQAGYDTGDIPAVILNAEASGAVLLNRPTLAGYNYTTKQWEVAANGTWAFQNNTLGGIGQLNVDNLTLDGNTLSSINENGDIILTTNGTGRVEVTSGDISGGGSVLLISGGTGGTGSVLDLRSTSGGLANDIYFKSNGSIVELQYDHSEKIWSFENGNQVAIQKTTDQLILGALSGIGFTNTTITSPPPSVSRVYTIPDFGSNDTFVGLAATQTLTNKTFGSTVNISSGALQIAGNEVISSTRAISGTTGSLSSSLTVGSGAVNDVRILPAQAALPVTGISASPAIMAMTAAYGGQAGDLVIHGRINSGGNKQIRFYGDNNGTLVNMLDLHPANGAIFLGDVDVVGALSKGSGTFKITHPLDENRLLYHSFVEAPQADNIYRGIVNLTGGTATVQIDTECDMTVGTFDALNGNVQVFVSNNDTWDLVKGSYLDGILTITSNNILSNATINWLVIGERKDQTVIDWSLTDENGHLIPEWDKPMIENPIVE